MATLAELQDELAKYVAARDKVLDSQEYSTAEFRNRRPELEKLEARIDRLRIEISRLEGSTTTYPKFSVRS